MSQFPLRWHECGSAPHRCMFEDARKYRCETPERQVRSGKRRHKLTRETLDCRLTQSRHSLFWALVHETADPSQEKGVDRVQNVGRLLEVRQVAGALDEGR